MIIPVWKKIGESTHLLAKKTGAKISSKTQDLNNLKATHTGTLDPMAEGVVVVLTGNDRYNKSNFPTWKKIYQFEILIGVETDSQDLLGLQSVIDKSFNVPNNVMKRENILNQINNVLPTFIGKQRQQQPKFSAQRVNGKSAFDLAKQQQKFEIKTNDIEIFSLKMFDSKYIEIEKLEKVISKKISLITGDFRQSEILKNWQKTFLELSDESTSLLIINFEAIVSKKTYIRSLVRDLRNLINIPMTTFSITRTNEGPYSKKDC